MSKPMIESALWYRRKGFSVIPCQKNKKPYIKWEPYQLQKPTEDEIREWWGKWPNANIGLPCGPVSGVDVLDVDTEEAYQNLTEFFLSDTFQTPIAKTPKGRHLYFKHRPGLSNAVRVVAGTDLRTLGGYVIAPPSQNGGGVPYYWLEGLKISKVEFAEWPADLFATLQQGGAVVKYNHEKNDLLISSRLPLVPSRSISFAEGGRDDSLFHLIWGLKKSGMPIPEIETYARFFASNCIPPFPTDEIDIKLKSAIERDDGKHGGIIKAVECYIDEDDTGCFSVKDCYENLLNRNSGLVERETVRKTLARFAKEKSKIVADQNRRGWYRKVRQEREEINFADTTTHYLNLTLPFHLEEQVRIAPGNIIIIAGVTNMGKTVIALDMIMRNMDHFDIHYFNDEMEGGELGSRLALFEGVEGGAKAWKMHSWRLPDFDEIPDVIVPGNGVINFIDYLDPPADKPYIIKDMMKKIHKRLDGALAVICLQLKPGSEAPAGGWGAIHRSRLAINIERNVVKVIKAKARISYDFDINGLHKDFDIIGGWRIVELSKWIT